MFLEFCAGIAFFVSLGVALQLRVMPFPRALKCLCWLALLLAGGAVALTLTTMPAKNVAAWGLLGVWLAAQVGAHVARRRWLLQLRANRGR